jgi:hypothetical protein
MLRNLSTRVQVLFAEMQKIQQVKEHSVQGKEVLVVHVEEAIALLVSISFQTHNSPFLS